MNTRTKVMTMTQEPDYRTIIGAHVVESWEIMVALGELLPQQRYTDPDWVRQINGLSQRLGFVHVDVGEMQSPEEFVPTHVMLQRALCKYIGTSELLKNRAYEQLQRIDG